MLNKLVNNDGTLVQTGMEENEGSDFTVDDLTLLKEIFLSLEKAVDDIVLPNALAGGGETFTGGYIFTLLEKANVSKTIKTLFGITVNCSIFFKNKQIPQITMGNVDTMIKLLDTLVTYLTTNAEASGSVFRRGVGLQDMHAFLQIVFSSSGEDLRQRMNRCYKVYVEPEPQKQTRGSRTNDNGWIQPKNVQKTKSTAKIVSFWCFSPGFGYVLINTKNIECFFLI